MSVIVDLPTHPYQRLLSPVERLWIAADRMCPPFVNQLVLEGEGKLDVEAWTRAVERVAQVTPGCRVRLTGWLHTCRWVESAEPPPVWSRDGTAWDGRSGAGAAFLKEPLGVDGPTCCVVLVEGTRPRVVVRTHHAVMDGRGHLHWVHDMFRVLRGEDPIGAPDRRTDDDLAALLQPASPPRREPTAIAPLLSQGEERGTVWARHSVPGRFSKLLPNLLLALAAESRSHQAGLVRFDIPVDLRSSTELENASTANLTGMIHVEVGPSDTVESVSAEVRSQLKSGRAAEFVVAARPLRFVPLALMATIGRWTGERSHRTHSWMATAVTSNLGRLPIQSMRYEGFTTRSAFFIPPGTEGNPLFLGITGIEDGVEMVATAPARLGGQGRLEACLQRVGERLRAR